MSILSLSSGRRGLSSVRCDVCVYYVLNERYEEKKRRRERFMLLFTGTLRALFEGGLGGILCLDVVWPFDCLRTSERVIAMSV